MFIASPIPALMSHFLNNRSSSEDDKKTVVQDKNKDILKKSNFSFFGVWVRSFDKRKLLFCQNFCLRKKYFGLPVSDKRNVYLIVGNSDILLGEYKNYDLALSVLNDLQNCLLGGFGVFEMPVSDISNYMDGYDYD